MKLRILTSAAMLAVVFLGGRHVAAQMSPMAAGYPPMGQMGYPSPYMPMVPPQFDVRQAAAMQQPMAAAADCGTCQADACGAASCNACNACNPCCGPCVSVWGEYMYLRARNAEIAYGVPINGAIVPTPSNPIQIAPIGMTDPDFSSGFRFGFGFALDECSAITFQYSWFQESTQNMVQTTAPNVIRSLVSHPGTFNAARDFLSAEAQQELSFDLIDVDYRHVISSSCNRTLTAFSGTRMGQFSQEFGADFFYNGTESVDTEIDFYGAGLRLGLEGEAFNCSRRWLCYGKTSASFMAGSFTADYDLVDSFDPEVVDTTWKAGRIVPMLEMELGMGWQSRCGTWRVTGGYLISAWYNVVTTDEWVKAVQSNNFVGLSDTITFDGLVLRCEGRF